MNINNKVAMNAVTMNDKWIDDFHVIVTTSKPDANLLSALKEKSEAWKIARKNFSDKAASDRHTSAEKKVYDIAKSLSAKVIQQGAVMKIVMPNAVAANNAKDSKGREINVGDKIDIFFGMSGWKDGGVVTKVGEYNQVWYKDAFGHIVKTQGNATTVKNSVVRNALVMNWNHKNSYKFFCVDPSMKAPCILSGWDFREDAQDDAQELKELHIPYKIVSRVTLERAGIDPNAESSWLKNRR